MSDVLNLVPRDRYTNSDAIEILENYLELAKRGEVVAVAVASVLDTGDTYTTTSECNCFPSLLGSITLLQSRAIANAHIIQEIVR